jgi:hypothetical protein
MNESELEAKIYDTYYDMGGDDARTSGLWKDVIDAKKSTDSLVELQNILEAVENSCLY